MISIRYRTGWLRFKTVQALQEVTGWSFKEIRFALKHGTAIKGLQLRQGEAAPEPVKSIRQPTQETTNMQDLKEQLRLAKRRHARAERVIKRYEASHFPGRIETNEIKHARKETKCMG